MYLFLRINCINAPRVSSGTPLFVFCFINLISTFQCVWIFSSSNNIYEFKLSNQFDSVSFQSSRQNIELLWDQQQWKLNIAESKDPCRYLSNIDIALYYLINYELGWKIYWILLITYLAEIDKLFFEMLNKYWSFNRQIKRAFTLV